MKSKICIIIILICIVLDICIIMAIKNHQIQVAREIPFNFQFISYKGEQSYTSTSALIGRLIANSNTYKNEPENIPDVICSQASAQNNLSIHAKIDNTSDQQEYLNTLMNLKNNLEKDHTYTISFEYNNDTNKISTIIISY